MGQFNIYNFYKAKFGSFSLLFHTIMYILLVLCLGFAQRVVMGQTELTNSDKQALLDEHNAIRRQVNPASQEMVQIIVHVYY